MTSLAVRFPDAWATLPVGEGGAEKVQEILEAMAPDGAEVQQVSADFFAALLPALEQWGITGFASLALPDEETGGLVQAYCAITVVPGSTGEEDLRAVAEGGPHADLAWETSLVRLPIGTAVRSVGFRHVVELADDAGFAPYAVEVRFALPLREDRIGVLHFQTMSLVYLDELTELFDAIAGTARLG